MIVHKILDFFALQILLTCQMFFAVNAFKVLKSIFVFLLACFETSSAFKSVVYAIVPHIISLFVLLLL